MRQPLVTIGITCCNDAKYVRTCLESVVNQTYPSIEVIVVDDNSTDRSIEIINEFADRLQLICHESNTGGYVTGRKEVIAHAKGDYVAHLDADDYLDPDFVARHVEAFSGEPGIDWVAGNLRMVDAEGRETDRWDYREFPTDPMAGLRRGFLTASVPVPKGGLLSLRFLREHGLNWYELPHTANGSDAFTCIKYLEHNPTIRFIPYFGLNHRIHGKNGCGTVVERIKMTIDIKEYFAENHNELLYLPHPDFLRLRYGSNEYWALKYYLLAVEFYRTMRDFRVPDQFRTGRMADEIQRSLGLFHEPIRRYAMRSLEYASTHQKQLEIILRATGQRTEGVLVARKTADAPDGEVERLDEGRLKAALRDNPASPAALNEMARLLLNRGDGQGAQEYAARAVRIAPNDPETLNNAGMIAFAAGSAPEAEVLFKRALAADPAHPDAHLNLCELWGQTSAKFAPDPQRKHDIMRTVHWISKTAPDPSRQTLMRENHRLRDDILKEYHDRYASANRSILLHRPSNGALKYLMESWQEVLDHMGVRTRCLNWGEKTVDVFEDFRPDMFITVADPTYIRHLDMDYISAYRRSTGCKVGHVTTFEHEYPPADFLVTFHFDPTRDPKMNVAEMPLISLPFAINPLQHYMRPGREVWDYFFVGTNSPRKIQRTKDYLLPVVQQYKGILAGTGWNVGIGALSVKDSAELYNFAKIYPNYSTPRHVKEFNEVNERTFIIPACGGFELMDNPVAVKELFDEDELVVTETPQQYLELFEFYLNNPEARLPFIEKGMRRVYREYTLFQVLEKLMPVFGDPVEIREANRHKAVHTC